MYFPVMLLAMVLTCVAAGVVHDVNDCQESSPLCDRLGQLERLVMGQSRLLRQLQSKLSDQEELNSEQAEELSKQRDQLRELLSKFSDQEQLNGKQHELIHQLQFTVSRQEEQLSEQGRLVDKLRAEKARESAELEKLEQQQNSMHANTHFEKATQESENPAARSESGSLVPSVTHVLKPRSDDGGPLEVVVSHMGQQLTEITADIQALKNSDQALKNTNLQQDQAIEDAQTSTFVHWGSSQCSNASQLVYSGVTGGSDAGQTGAATNYLCLTMSPVLSDHAVPGGLAYLYGGEYQTYDSYADKDPLCAVCRSRHSTTIMIPGTNVCTPGWHQHYSGFLMAGAYNHPAGSEFICVDSRMESRAGTSRNDNGKLFYFTVTSCGSLPCDPYVNKKVVTCVVCSK